MQRKKLKLLLASLAASTILCSAPLLAKAADPDEGPDYDLSTITSSVSLSEKCNSNNKKCPGHRITQGNIDKSRTIAVVGGTHTVYFDSDIKITGDVAAPPFEIYTGATVDLYLGKDTTSTLDNSTIDIPDPDDSSQTNPSKGGAGLQVRNKGNLIIHGPGTLKAQGSSGGAGIGGFTDATGNITILGGRIEATGGEAAAGIGSGSKGKCGNISIKNDAEVVAIGGNAKEYKVNGVVESTQPGGPGIGHAQTYESSGGNIDISGGKVFAIGGTVEKGSTDLTTGILCDTLSSLDGSGDIFTNDTSLTGVINKGTQEHKLNAIVWEAEDDTATKNNTTGVIWGDGTISEDIHDTHLLLRPDSTLTIAKNPTSLQDCIIRNFGNSDTPQNNAIYNRDYISTDLPPLPKGIKEYVSLSEKTIDIAPKMNKDEIFYTGEDLTDKILVPKERTPRSEDDEDESNYYYVDTNGWDHYISRYESAPSLDTKILRRGTYTVTYKHKNPFYTKETVKKSLIKNLNLQIQLKYVQHKFQIVFSKLNSR